MYKLITLLFLIGFAVVCNAQTGLGIGLVSINFDDNTVIHFYAKPDGKQKVKTIQFFTDKSINGWNIKNLEAQKQWLKPETLWLDYSSFNFRCESKNNGWYEVIVNNQTGKTFWIKKERFTEFLTWEKFLKSKFVVERLPKYKQAIRQLPSNDSAKIKYVGKDCFQVKSMKGEWIEIFTSDFCKSGYGDSKTTEIQSGWIKWKNGNTLLIDYRLAD